MEYQRSRGQLLFLRVKPLKKWYFHQNLSLRRNQFLHILFFFSIILLLHSSRVNISKTFINYWSNCLPAHENYLLTDEKYKGVVVSYAYKDGVPKQKDNFEYFLKHGLTIRKDVSFVFTLNDAPHCKYKNIIPKRENIEIRCKKNEGFDTCAHYNVMKDEKYKRKKYMVIMNGSARGPFSPGDCVLVNRTLPSLSRYCSGLRKSSIRRQRRLDSSGRFWVDRLTDMIERSKTNGKIAGSYISCERSPHVQSWLAVAHRDVFYYLGKTMRCFGSQKDAIINGEVAFSRLSLENGFNILSPIKEFFDVDFRKGTPPGICGQHNPGISLGFCPNGVCRSLNPLETIFFKNSGGLERDQVLDRGLLAEVDYLTYLKGLQKSVKKRRKQ